MSVEDGIALAVLDLIVCSKLRPQACSPRTQKEGNSGGGGDRLGRNRFENPCKCVQVPDRLLQWLVGHWVAMDVMLNVWIGAKKWIVSSARENRERMDESQKTAL